MHEPHPVSCVGTIARQRGQRAMNGLVISIRHWGQMRTSSWSSSSSDRTLEDVDEKEFMLSIKLKSVKQFRQ